MKSRSVLSFRDGPQAYLAASAQYNSIMTAQRKLLVAWFFLGLLPLILQSWSYLKFATPHKITENLLVPPGAEAKTLDLTELCPMKGFHIGHVWWSVDTTHYHTLEHGHLCHFIVPQYNSHGNFMIGNRNVEPFFTAPRGCANESFPVELYFYHGSVGYYSFYDELVGTYCTMDSTAYTHVAGVGTFDINGIGLAHDLGSDGYRWSCWYSIAGAIWLVFRGLVLRRCYIACKRYGAKCDQMGANLRRKAATIFVHENLRLSAHGATNYQRVMLLYFLLEGLMSDLFLLAATDGSFAWVQYASLGYNLSGVLLVLFEIIERMGWLRENTRLFFKRLLFSYESSLLGEFFSAVGEPSFLSSLNRSGIKNTRPTAVVVSYYMWSLVGHGIIVLVLIGFITFVRILRAVTYVHWKHGRIREIFWAPCCVDTTFGVRNKMTKLAGYHWENGKLYYKADALNSFGLLKMEEEDGTEFLVLNKLRWFEVRTDDLMVIGTVSDERVEPCAERPCTGVVSLFNRNLGGPVGDAEIPTSAVIRVRNKVSPSPSTLSVIPPHIN